MPEDKLWTRTYFTRDQVPVCPVFTRAKIKSRSGIKVNSRHSYLYKRANQVLLHIIGETVIGDQIPKSKSMNQVKLIAWHSYNRKNRKSNDWQEQTIVNENIRKCRDILMRLMDIIRFLAKQNLALRTLWRNEGQK